MTLGSLSVAEAVKAEMKGLFFQKTFTVQASVLFYFFLLLQCVGTVFTVVTTEERVKLIIQVKVKNKKNNWEYQTNLHICGNIAALGYTLQYSQHSLRFIVKLQKSCSSCPGSVAPYTTGKNNYALK